MSALDLRGCRGLSIGIGIANEHSIAAGCAAAFADAGATLEATCRNAKSTLFVRAVTDRLDCPILMPCDMRIPGQL